jgi:pimeloyl-ACP methyl ester carboxylesterase
MQHKFADLSDVRIHYVTQGSGPPVFLLHGWPHTWLSWRHVIPLLSKHHQVIAPDLRGLGDSSKPESGYDVGTLAGDILGLADSLEIEHFSVIGHDWGGPVAFATAVTDRSRVDRVGIVDVVVPGDGRQAGASQGGLRWHHAFHRTPDLPEALTEGREGTYLRWFYDEYSSTPGAVSAEVFEEYVRAYSRPNAMRCGFNYYRSFEQHAAYIAQALKQGGKLKCPVLGVAGGSGRGRGDEVRQSLVEVAQAPVCHVIARSGHLVPEEAPAELGAILMEFLAD